MSRRSQFGPESHIVRGPHRGAYEWTHHFDRAERHRLVQEDRAARNTVLLVLAGAIVSGLAILLVTLIGYV
jgi:hypothetical protein